MSDKWENKENVPYIDAKEAYRPILKPRKEPAVDNIVSQIVRKKVYVNDPKLITLVKKYKAMKSDPEAMDDFFKNPHFLEGLKETFK